MMKPVTGQYECQHSSGIGLDYFTSRIDRLTLQAGGRFSLTVQERSRISNAAQSLVSGQQVTATAPEIRREGNYTYQGSSLQLSFDDGAHEMGQISWNGEGIQIGQNFFNKVSDSTLLPPTHRLKKDMDDIAKGVKIATTLGGMALKAAKTIHETIQSTQGPTMNPNVPQGGGAGTAGAPRQQSYPAQPAQPSQPAPQPAQPMQNAAAHPLPSASPVSQPPRYTPPPAQPVQPVQGQVEALFCDQCGARSRPGKRFCNNCGARLM